MPTEAITCAYSKCDVTRPLYLPVIDTDDGKHFVLSCWPVCREHRFDLAELVSTRSRFYRMLVEEFRERLISPPLPGEFDVEFQRLDTACLVEKLGARRAEDRLAGQADT